MLLLVMLAARAHADHTIGLILLLATNTGMSQSLVNPALVSVIGNPLLANITNSFSVSIFKLSVHACHNIFLHEAGYNTVECHAPDSLILIFFVSQALTGLRLSLEISGNPALTGLPYSFNALRVIESSLVLDANGFPTLTAYSRWGAGKTHVIQSWTT